MDLPKTLNGVYVMISLVGDLASMYANSVYQTASSPITTNRIKSQSEQLDEAREYNTSFDDTAATLTLSDASIRVIAKAENTSYSSENFMTMEQEDQQEKEQTEEISENVLARIPKFMSRSLQLERESADHDITAADRQTIQNEIHKINLVVNNLSSDSTKDATEIMEGSIDMTGDLVSHSSANILKNATDALLAQSNSFHESALALLA